MINKDKLRQVFINRIKKSSGDKLDSFQKYIENSIDEKSEILALSGTFKDLDKDIMKDLTIHPPKCQIQATTRVN